jgi:hypothetical protein
MAAVEYFERSAQDKVTQLFSNTTEIDTLLLDYIFEL